MKTFLIIFTTALLLGISSCHDANKSAEYAPGISDYQNKSKEQQEEGENHVPPPPPGNDGVEIDRKLVKEGNLVYKVDNLASSKKRLLQSVAKYKGYVSNETSYHDYDRNNLTLEIRVPAIHFDSLVNEAMVGIQHPDRMDIKVQDVTAEFVDIEARIKTKKELEQRYLTLLGKANSVQEILEIEREIGVLRSDIESIEGRMKVLNNSLAFATLEVTIYQNIPAPSLFGERWVNSFGEGWQNLLDFTVGITSLWPFLFLGAGAYWGIRRWRHRKKVGP
jgi:hypothetical protein